MKTRIGPIVCGFCEVGQRHDLCPVVVRNGANASVRLIFCACPDPGCQAKGMLPRCVDCKNTRAVDIDNVSWTCLDQDACTARRQQRLDSDPLVQEIIQIKERVKMTETATKVEKAKAAPKVGVCIVTGEPTKGGKFKPGMDARYVSNKVAEVLDPTSKATETTVLKEMEGHGLSDTLKGKFKKSLRLATEAAAKKAQAEKDKAAAKAEAKAQAAKATAETEATSAPSPDADAT